jgi:hypothetical protein
MDRLQKWVEAGLVTQDQATAIERFEESESSSRSEGLSPGMEVVAYVGAAVTLVALIIIVAQYFEEIGDWGQVALGAVVTIALLAAGEKFAESPNPSSMRASLLARFLSVAAVALTTGLIVKAMGWADDHGDETMLIVSVVALGLAGWLWTRSRTSIQMIALAITSFAVTMTSIDVALILPSRWVWALAPAVLGTAWVLLGTSGVFTPRRTTLVLGALGLLSAPLFSTDFDKWAVFGIAVALVVAWLAVPLTESALMGLAVAALVIYIPATVLEFFDGSLAFTLALLGLGLLLLAFVLYKDKVRALFRTS